MARTQLKLIRFWLLVFTWISSHYFSVLRAQPSLDDKIGQMLMVSFAPGTTFEDTVYTDIQERNLGGVILFAFMLENPQQIAELTQNLQSYAQTPLFICTDQEGGIVARLDENNGYEETYTAYELGTVFDNEDSTRGQAYKMATWLYEGGINTNFAPVVDVNINPESPAIGYYERSFSADPMTVLKHARWFISEFADYNIISTLKHFPGHGSAEQDSHLGFTDITNTWTDAELIPYQGLIGNGYQDMIMTGHLYNALFDPDYPASLSYNTIQGLLRDSLGFDGVVVSDAMFMRAITNNFAFDEAIELAINAGTDMLLYTTNEYDGQSLARQVIDIVKVKVSMGIIPESRINESYTRIQQLKSRISRVPGQTRQIIPEQYTLHVYPNPFNITTNIQFTLTKPDGIEFEIFDITGRRVYFEEKSRLATGRYTICFTAENLASGTYIVRVNGSAGYSTQKIMLIK